jgi:hypothetical protein
MLIGLLFAIAGQTASPPLVSITFSRDTEQRLGVTVQPSKNLTVRSIALERYDTIALRTPRTIESLANGGRRATFDPQPDRVTILVRLSDRSAASPRGPSGPGRTGQVQERASPRGTAAAWPLEKRSLKVR